MLDGDRIINRLITLALLATALVAACEYAEDVAGRVMEGNRYHAWLAPLE